jgi:hypothetical protein
MLDQRAGSIVPNMDHQNGCGYFHNENEEISYGHQLLPPSVPEEQKGQPEVSQMMARGTILILRFCFVRRELQLPNSALPVLGQKIFLQVELAEL